MQRINFTKSTILALTAVGALTLLLLDIETPIGLAIPFLYILLAPLVVWFRSGKAAIAAVIVMAGLSGVGLWASTWEGGPFAGGVYGIDEFIRDTVINRLIAIALFSAVLFLLVRIQNAQDELHRLSTTDPLTGALNRRRFEELAEVERRRAARSGAPMALLILDIDHFKSVNDRFGHAAGDAAIRVLSQTCQATLRPGDLFGRWGGEEFVIALPETSLSGAMKTAERLREVIAKAEFLANGKARRITVSIGVAALLRDELAVDHAINRADRALYRAKEAGRNRVESDPANAE
jgi:diguanylate cyclase (GGDEF)-like protein